MLERSNQLSALLLSPELCFWLDGFEDSVESFESVLEGGFAWLLLGTLLRCCCKVLDLCESRGGDAECRNDTDLCAGGRRGCGGLCSAASAMSTLWCVVVPPHDFLVH